MLQSLHIENVAVIECADIVFGRGLTVLTGETGAGKSIVIDAINAVLGERISRDAVRHGAERAFVSAVFTDVGRAVEDTLTELGFTPEEDGTLLIGRQIAADGKGSCRINGRPATVSVLRQIGRMLVNIHGQHENQTLLQPDSHIGYLDRLGSLVPLRDAYAAEYHAYCRIARRIRAATIGEDEKQRRSAELQQALEEIDAAHLQPGEEADLTERREVMRHAERLAQELTAARAALDGDDEDDEDRGALARLSDAVGALRTAGGVSRELSQLAERLQSALYDVQACADEVRDAQRALAFDEGELTALEDRLMLVRQIARKYGGSESAALERREELAAELERIESNEAELSDLRREQDAARERTVEAARRLTAARRSAADLFEKNVCEQLAFLDMPNVRLAVSMEPTALTVTGGDKVEFLLSANPGEPPKSIARTASGGELSRIMLALKSVLSEVDDIGTLVFDEVDSGISGHAAARVGVLLRRIAACRQVLCVTHLAQIAACGHAHLLVHKHVEDGRTFTAVQALDEAARRGELARIIGGEVTDTALRAAEEMRRRAEADGRS